MYQLHRLLAVSWFPSFCGKKNHQGFFKGITNSVLGNLYVVGRYESG